MTRQPITKFTSPEFAIYVYGDGGVELHNHSAGALAFNSRDELLRMVEFIAQHDLSLRIVRVNGHSAQCNKLIKVRDVRGLLKFLVKAGGGAKRMAQGMERVTL